MRVGEKNCSYLANVKWKMQVTLVSLAATALKQAAIEEDTIAVDIQKVP